MTAAIKSEIVFVTPETAKEYLLLNDNNRKVRVEWVNYLAHLITHNEWQVTHQGIAFSESGRLLDGQHRLMAIVKADIPVSLLVTYRMPDQAFSAIDNGIKRTDADLTALPKKLTEICKFFVYVMAFEGLDTAQNKGNGRRVTPQQLLDYADTLRVFCDFLIKKAPATPKVFGSTAGTAAAVAAIMMGESPDYVATLYRQLTLGDTENMPPIGRSAVRQVLNGTLNTYGGGEGRTNVFVRMISVFKEANKNNLKLVMRDRQIVLNEVRSNLKPWFSTNPDMNLAKKIDKYKAVITSRLTNMECAA